MLHLRSYRRVDTDSVFIQFLSPQVDHAFRYFVNVSCSPDGFILVSGEILENVLRCAAYVTDRMTLFIFIVLG